MDTLAAELADASACPPRLILAVGKCRVGSTPLNQIFGYCGVPSLYQPLKSLLRNALDGREPTATGIGRHRDAETVFVKETLGPYTRPESHFNPLQTLLAAGYPPARLELVLLERDPLAAFDSWLEHWSELLEPRRLVENFVLASLAVGRVRETARRRGIRVTHYAHEASLQPLAAMRALFSRLGLESRFLPEAVENLPPSSFRSPKACIFFPEVADWYCPEDTYRTWQSYRFRARSRGSRRGADEAMMRTAGLFELYLDALESCERELALDLLAHPEIHELRDRLIAVAA